MITIPKNERSIPTMFITGSFSLSVYRATSGVNRGIVPMTTAHIVGVEYFSPKFSPRKYKNGLKRAVIRNRRMSFLNIFSVLPRILSPKYKMIEDKTNLRNIVVMGS
jgi:hypothetical protein